LKGYSRGDPCCAILLIYVDENKRTGKRNCTSRNNSQEGQGPSKRNLEKEKRKKA
jgi:hypothetical protein